MKNRLKHFFKAEVKPAQWRNINGAGNIRQLKLMTLYNALAREAKDADIYLKGHYEHLLLSLKRLIESYGQSPDYKRWVNSISAN
jgi:hypothetical protein